MSRRCSTPTAQFHVTILEATRNQVMQQMRQLILTMLRVSYEYGVLRPAHDPVTRAGHVRWPKRSPVTMGRRRAMRWPPCSAATRELRATTGAKCRSDPAAPAPAPTGRDAQWTAANMIFSGVAARGSNSSTTRPWRNTSTRSEIARISGM